jgi:hypothetical protein
VFLKDIKLKFWDFNLKHLILGLLLVINFPTSLFPQDPAVQNIINQTNPDSLDYFVQKLSGEVPAIISGSSNTIVSRHKNNSSNNKAADYIKQKLNSYGLTTFDQWFSATGRNVYGVQTGTVYPNKKYIICAHYDDMPSGSVAPGADDNASGTAAVIEAARIFSKYSFPFTIVFALFDEEEQGLVGSTYYAQQAYNAGDSIIGVINIDMISYDSNNDNVAEIHTRPIAVSIALKDKMVDVNSTYNLGVAPNIKNPGSTASDHSPFWNRGYSAILLIEHYNNNTPPNDFNAYYHTANDLLIHFNIPYFIKLSKLAVGTLATLAISNTPLPVELSLFTAEYIYSSVLLKWRTETEVNNYGFSVERRIDGKDWQSIIFVRGHGNSNSPKEYSYTDLDILAGGNIFQYRLKQIDNDGTYIYSELVEVEVIVKQYELFQNYPNPFNPTTYIEFKVPVSDLITLKVFDVLGNEVSTLVNEQKAVGKYKVTFDASNLPSGTYFYTLQTGSFMGAKKMILLK